MNFPISVEAFAANQERMINRPLTQEERELTAAWVPVINDVYRYGLSAEDLAVLDHLIEKHKENKAIARFLRGAKSWMLYAQRQNERAAT